jgi:3-oxoacyl-[acyl-carrier protein] reductase
MGKLRDKVALITGSSSGIGRGVAIAFAREGAKVIVNYPDESETQNAAAVRAEIERIGVQALDVRADVSVEHEAQALVETVQRSRRWRRASGTG